MVAAAATNLRSLGVDLPDATAEPDLDRYLAGLGITYVAPGDARATGLDDASIDAATSTSVLEHSPPDDIAAILRELRRVLVPGGLCSFAVDYHDHFAGADADIDGLHFLRYSDREWARWNSDLQFQNRLRHLDHRALFEEAGFEIVAEEAVEDPALPADPPLDARFAGRPDLAVGDGWFVLANPPG